MTFNTDLAAERRRADTDCPGVEFKRCAGKGFFWEKIRITSPEGEASIGRPMGKYYTLNIESRELPADEEIATLSEELAEGFLDIAPYDFSPYRILVVGLGNAALTPDAIGPRSASLVNATMHLRELEVGPFSEFEFAEIATICPGVTASSGLEAVDIVRSVCDRVRPDFVIAIDALASRSAERLGRTVQLSDTGIFPGAGIGNKRLPLNEETLGVPVIAVGVPTVINTEAFILGEDFESEAARAKLRKRKKDAEAIFVSPREIDGIVDAFSKIIASGINRAFGII